MPAKITIKSYYGSAVLLDKICLTSSSQFYGYHFARVKALINDIRHKIEIRTAKSSLHSSLRASRNSLIRLGILLI